MTLLLSNHFKIKIIMDWKYINQHSWLELQINIIRHYINKLEWGLLRCLEEIWWLLRKRTHQRVMLGHLFSFSTCWRTYEHFPTSDGTEIWVVGQFRFFERCFREIRRRTRPMGTFSDRTSMDRIMFSVVTCENLKQGMNTPFLLLTQNTWRYQE